ncbi:MAG: DUF2239 family protein [Rhodoblastus sp.]|nr:MAG: DUF2239 family protein [Rhodoblastus sp.]
MLIFEEEGGRQIDFDLRGGEEEVLARLDPPAPSARRLGPGRPRLGVVAREVTLLPRHWEWLAAQPGGASTTLRKLVEAARKTDAGKTDADARKAAADNFMRATLGDRPGYEEAARALYAGDRARFFDLTQPWPADLRDHARKLAQGAFV